VRNRSKRLSAAWSLAVVLLPTSGALAQASPADSRPRVWAFQVTATGNFLPDQTDYIQPTVSADRGALHLEGRYNYEDLKSASGFIGWNYETGSKVTLRLTPMFGAVTGQTDGVIPAFELSLEFGHLGLDTESEYVLDLNDSNDSFFYHWSELTLSTADWVSAGLVIQRSRLIHNSREVQGGPMVRLTRGPIEGAAYFFNPGSEDHYFLGSITVSF